MLWKGGRAAGHTEGGWDAAEDEGVGVLEEGDPAHASRHPALEQARRVQQRMHVTMPVRLCLYREWVVRIQRQVRFPVAQACHLMNHSSDLIP